MRPTAQAMAHELPGVQMAHEERGDERAAFILSGLLRGQSRAAIRAAHAETFGRDIDHRLMDRLAMLAGDALRVLHMERMLQYRLSGSPWAWTWKVAKDVVLALAADRRGLILAVGAGATAERARGEIHRRLNEMFGKVAVALLPADGEVGAAHAPSGPPRAVAWVLGRTEPPLEWLEAAAWLAAGNENYVGFESMHEPPGVVAKLVPHALSMMDVARAALRVAEQREARAIEARQAAHAAELDEEPTEVLPADDDEPRGADADDGRGPTVGSANWDRDQEEDDAVDLVERARAHLRAALPTHLAGGAPSASAVASAATHREDTPPSAGHDIPRAEAPNDTHVAGERGDLSAATASAPSRQRRLRRKLMIEDRGAEEVERSTALVRYESPAAEVEQRFSNGLLDMVWYARRRAALATSGGSDDLGKAWLEAGHKLQAALDAVIVASTLPGSAPMAQVPTAALQPTPVQPGAARGAERSIGSRGSRSKVSAGGGGGPTARASSPNARASSPNGGDPWTPYREAVFAFIAAHPKTKRAAIDKAVGYPSTRTRRLLEELRNAGRVKKNGGTRGPATYEAIR